MGRPKKTSSPTGFVPKKIQGLEGSWDVITQTDVLWEVILKRLNKMSRVYGFSEVQTAPLETLYLYESFYKNDPVQLKAALGLDIEGKPAVLRSSFLPSIL